MLVKKKANVFLLGIRKFGMNDTIVHLNKNDKFHSSTVSGVMKGRLVKNFSHITDGTNFITICKKLHFH